VAELGESVGNFLVGEAVFEHLIDEVGRIWQGRSGDPQSTMLRHRFSVTSQEWKRHKLVQIAQDWINYINRWRTFGERAAGQWAVARQGHHALFSGSVERRSVARAEALEAGGSTLVEKIFLDFGLVRMVLHDLGFVRLG